MKNKKKYIKSYKYTGFIKNLSNYTIKHNIILFFENSKIKLKSAQLIYKYK